MAASAGRAIPSVEPQSVQDAASVSIEDTPNLFSHLYLITRSDIERLEAALDFKVDKGRDYMSLKDSEDDSR
jgi:hypothetical protein